MKHLRLFLFCSLALGQVRVTFEPQPLDITQRVVGSRDFGLWTVFVEGDGPLSRSTIMAASEVSELTPEMARDIMQRAANGSRWSLLGRGFDLFAPLGSQAASGYAVAQDSRAGLYVSGVLTVATIIRNLLRGTAPDPRPYFERLLPEMILCTAGNCGGPWYVVTGLVPGASRFQFHIGNALALEKLRQARIQLYGRAW